MAIKSFPSGFDDITSTATKLMAAKPDGSSGYSLFPDLNKVTASGNKATLSSETTVVYPIVVSNEIGSNPDKNNGVGLKMLLNNNSNVPVEAGAIDFVNTFYLDQVAAVIRVRTTGGTLERARISGGGLTVTGSIVASGTITPGSDKRLKKNVATLPTGTLGLINQLRPVSYKMKDTSLPSLGFIADEVRTLFPDLIIESESSEKMLAMNYMGLTAPIVKAIQELSAQNEELLSRLEALEKSK